MAQHPDIVEKMRKAYDQWWEEVLPAMENEDAVGPKVNPFKERYWRQFGGSPDEQLLKRMDPTGTGGQAENNAPKAKKSRKKQAP